MCLCLCLCQRLFPPPADARRSLSASKSQIGSCQTPLPPRRPLQECAITRDHPSPCMMRKRVAGKFFSLFRKKREWWGEKTVSERRANGDSVKKRVSLSPSVETRVMATQYRAFLAAAEAGVVGGRMTGKKMGFCCSMTLCLVLSCQPYASGYFFPFGHM